MMLPKQTREWLQSPISLLVLLCIFITLFTLAYQPRKRLDIDLAAQSSEKFLDHFYPVENGARWTEARSGLWLPALGGGSLAWRVGLSLSGPQPGRFGIPAHVIVRVNGAMLAEFDARNQKQDHEWDIRPWQLGPNGDLLLEIDSSTFKSSDDREFGVSITHVWLTRSGGIALPSVRGFLLTLALVGCCAALLRMSSTAGLIPARAMGMADFLNPLRNTWAWILVAVWLLIILARSWNHPQAAWWLQTLTFGLLLITALIWLIARVVSGSLTRDQVLRVLILFILAAIVRIPFDLGRGYEGDIASYGREGDIATDLALAWKTVSYGIHAAYLQVNGSLPSDNPPLLLYPFWFLGWLYEQLISPLFGHTRLGDPDMLRFMLRLPGLAADLFAGALIFRVLRQRSSISFNAALLVTGAYLFNPALIFDSAYWGQTAAVHALLMLLSVIAADRRCYDWAGAALAAAILTKPQAIAIAPLILILAMKERGGLRLVAGAGIATVLITAPFIWAGTSASVVQEYTQTTRYHPFVAPNAHNLWWFVTGGQGWQQDTNLIGPVSFRSAGLLIFTAATLLSLILVWRDRRSLFLVAAYQALAFFMLNTQIHETHLLAIFAPLVIAAALDRELWWFYGAFALTSVANMTLHDPKLFAWLGYPSNEIYGGPALALPRWLNAAIQSLLFVAFTVRLIIPLAAELRLTRTRIQA